MSHGHASEGSTCEPNLTPLLDLVLQILMFFMITVNFATQSSPGKVELPFSDEAVALTRSTEPLFLNLVYDAQKREHRVEAFRGIKGEPPMKLNQARLWVQGQYEDIKRHGEVKNPVSIRADR